MKRQLLRCRTAYGTGEIACTLLLTDSQVQKLPLTRWNWTLARMMSDEPRWKGWGRVVDGVVGVQELSIDSLERHRELAGRACFGSNFRSNWITRNFVVTIFYLTWTNCLIYRVLWVYIHTYIYRSKRLTRRGLALSALTSLVLATNSSGNERVNWSSGMLYRWTARFSKRFSIPIIRCKMA